MAAQSFSDGGGPPVPDAGRSGADPRLGAAFERMAALAVCAARAPMALVRVVDADRQGFEAVIGLVDADAAARLADKVADKVSGDGPAWVEDARQDGRFADDPLIAGEPRVRFCAAVPVIVAGFRSGTVCVMDVRPRPYDAQAAEALRLLGESAADAFSLRRSLTELADARDSAATAARAKSDFLTNMSHEIRTPLNGVLGMAGALRRTTLDGAQREMVGLIETSGATLGALLDDVLDIARVESGRLQLRMDSFRLDDVIRQSAVLFAPEAARKGVALTLGRAPDRLYLGDATRLRQILSSLISNAVKFTEAGKVEVRVAARPVDDGDEVRISVSDTGIGFRPEMFERLTQRFEQGDASLTRRRGGAGLGLAISRALAQMLGGKLEASSEPGRGSTFTLFMTLQHLDLAAGGHAGEIPPRLSGPQPSVRVLLAEDNAANRRVVELILGAADVDLMTVENGAEAVEAFKAARFDLILMDMQMPVLDGLAATRAIRRLEAESGVARTAICMVSAHAMPEHIEAGLAAGADSYLAKPITAEALLSVVAASVAAET